MGFTEELVLPRKSELYSLTMVIGITMLFGVLPKSHTFEVMVCVKKHATSYNSFRVKHTRVVLKTLVI